MGDSLQGDDRGSFSLLGDGKRSAIFEITLDDADTLLRKRAFRHKTTVTAVAVAGPYVGSLAVTYNYIAMPATPHIMLLVWLEPNFQHNTFVYNFLDHESSMVTYDQAGDPSLGSVFIVKAGKYRIP